MSAWCLTLFVASCGCANAFSHGTYYVHHHAPHAGSPLDPVADNANPLSPEAQRNMAKQYVSINRSGSSSRSFSPKPYVEILAVRTCTRTGPCTRLSVRPFRCRCTWGEWRLPWRSWGVDPRHQCRGVPESPVDYLCSSLPCWRWPCEFCRGGVFYSPLLPRVTVGADRRMGCPKPLVPANFDPGAGPMAMIAVSPALP